MLSLLAANHGGAGADFVASLPPLSTAAAWVSARRILGAANSFSLAYSESDDLPSFAPMLGNSDSLISPSSLLRLVLSFTACTIWPLVIGIEGGSDVSADGHDDDYQRRQRQHDEFDDFVHDATSIPK
jgi:hypothetical protein